MKHLCQGLLVAAIALLAALAPARAQVVLIVNGDPITNYDIEQRAKLIQLTLHKTAPRQEVIDDLIDDKLKISIGKRYKIEIGDKDVDSSFGEMGRRARLNPQQFTQMLAHDGVDPAALKEHIKAEIFWATIVRAKFQSSLQVDDKDVRTALEGRKEKEALVFEYTLRPILFVVPRGAGEDIVATRRQDAEALRARFDGCETGIRLARVWRDVVVRQSIIKSSGDLAPELREILDKVPVGHLTDPEVTAQGIELFALCAKREVKPDVAGKREVQNELFAKRFEAQGKRYLQELRRGAMIEVKDPSIEIKDHRISVRNSGG